MGGLESLRKLRRQLASILTRPPALAFIPALSLAVFWFGGEGALLAISAALPIAYFLGNHDTEQRQRADRQSGVIVSPDMLHDAACAIYEQTRTEAGYSATFIIEVEEIAQVNERFGPAAGDTALKTVGERLLDTLRQNDVVGQLSQTRFGICLGTVRHLDLELCIQLSARLQAAVEEPISIDGTAVYVTASIGFCQHARSPSPDGAAWLDAASIALHAAQHRGPSSIRAFSDQMRIEAKHRAELHEEVAAALDGGQIKPWFQPQISTDTGQITGFEALARWHHPERGMISPADFLPAIEACGLLERLAEVIMYNAFAALKAWDGAGVDVPQVGVNFAGSELSNPGLLDKIKWELDRFDLTPDRLAVEVLETVVASAPDDMITRNINALGKLGCRIDLDDFGTGHASIASIRRFSVSRIKIDRSFVMRADRDPEQQRMISAILTMAERLEVETLAEGVESVGEHVLLAQLGCDHVQGFGIGKPMPFEQTLDWITKHNAKIEDVPQIINAKRK